MPINCAIIVRPNANSEQLAALGTAVWRWCSRAARNSGMHAMLDDQDLADLIAGRAPVPTQGERSGVYFRIAGDTTGDRKTVIDSLRRQIPLDAVADLVVGGRSWDLVD